MEKRTINPWKWQDERHYAQAVEVQQAAVHPDGSSSTADMRTQLLIAIQNLEQVIQEYLLAQKAVKRPISYLADFQQAEILKRLWAKVHGVPILGCLETNSVLNGWWILS